MHRIAKQFIVLFVVFSLAVVPFATVVQAGVEDQAKEATAGSMIADVVFLRPVGVVGCFVGLCAYIVSAPFAAAGGNIEASREALVEKPFAFTFKRGLGEF